MYRSRALTLAFLLAIALIVAGLLRHEPGAAQTPAAKGEAAVGRGLVGAPSCSASACHGGVEVGMKGSEVATWRNRDPHARAYDSLLSDEGKAIAVHLWGDRTKAHEAPLCLKCHVNPNYEQSRPGFRMRDGVSCESCHGAAQDWIAPHHRPEWKSADQRTFGFADTRSLQGRANACAICHVGTAGANVDHDLIAAGHPPLRFEFATYFANLPPHWDVKRDRRANSTKSAEGEPIDFELRAWAIGQLVTSASAFDLLAHRAEPKTGKVWPEFAEFNCYSCHHDLAQGRPRQSTAHLQKRKPGSMAWSTWYHTMAPALSALEFDLRKRPEDRAQLAHHAREAALRLRVATAAPQDTSEQLQILKLVADRIAREGAPADWENATQCYLGFLAMQQASKDMNLKLTGFDKTITQLGRDLTFPPGFNSPKK